MPGVAVFRLGLKNGVFTTVAETRWRTASMLISNSRTLPGFANWRFNVASAMSFLSVGDYVVEFAFPI